MGARTFEMAHDRVALGDQFDDLHFKVRKGALKRAHPALRDLGEFTRRQLVDDVDVALRNHLVDQPAH